MLTDTQHNNTRSPAVAEIGDRTVWNSNGQHAKYGCSRRVNFGGSLVHSMPLIYSPDGTNVNGARTTEFEGSGAV